MLKLALGTNRLPQHIHITYNLLNFECNLKYYKTQLCFSADGFNLCILIQRPSVVLEMID